MPGGGAEVFSSRVGRVLYPGKNHPDRWIEIHRVAHSMGIRSNATLLYGHIETYEERVDHFMRLRSYRTTRAASWPSFPWNTRWATPTWWHGKPRP